MPGHARFHLAALAALLVCSSAIAEPTTGVAATHYDLELDLDYAHGALEAWARIELVNPYETTRDEVSITLYRLLTVRSASDGEGNDLPFTQGVVSVEDYPVLQLNQVIVTLPEPMAPGDEFVLELEYDGYLLGYAETGMSYVKDVIDTEFTILRTDSWVFPRPGYPTIASSRASVAWEYSFSSEITVPSGLTIVCGGRLDGVDEGEGVRTFRHSSVVPSWRMDFAIADYSELSAGPIRICYLPGDDEGAAGVAQAARDALGAFSEWFGPRPSEAPLTFIEIPDGWGSQTYTGTIIQSGGAFKDPRRYREVYHEVSHLWNVLGTDEPSPRWEEGLATFLEFHLAGDLTGEPYLERLEEWLLGVLAEGLEANPAWKEVPLVDYGKANLTDLSYRAGALFFDLLHRLEGQDRFNSIIGDYIHEHAESGGTTLDLVDVIRRYDAPGTEALCQDWILTAAWTEFIASGATVDQMAEHYLGG
jgi:hypothetical protein